MLSNSMQNFVINGRKKKKAVNNDTKSSACTELKRRKKIGEYEATKKKKKKDFSLLYRQCIDSIALHIKISYITLFIYFFFCEKSRRKN